MRILISYAIQLFCLSCRARVGLLTTMSCGTRTISQLMGFSLWRTISAIHTRGAPVLSQWVSWDIFGPYNPWQIKTIILPVKLRYIWQWCCFLFSWFEPTVPPAYYAHLAAFRARFYLEPDLAENGSGGGKVTRVGGESGVRPLPALKENVKRVMFYCWKVSRRWNSNY